MTLTVEIPDEVAGALTSSGQERLRAILEAIALEGYRAQRLSESAVRRLLGFSTRTQVHGFLKQHGVFSHHGLEDLEHDMREADRVAAILKGNPSERQHG
ncbi:MAG TPA: UPF0175 family protein [Bryobacteraceae bacterium]|nr:UPF0175 family protein [Bryobacteraceae bacterium]